MLPIVEVGEQPPGDPIQLRGPCDGWLRRRSQFQFDLPDWDVPGGFVVRQQRHLQRYHGQCADWTERWFVDGVISGRWLDKGIVSPGAKYIVCSTGQGWQRSQQHAV